MKIATIMLILTSIYGLSSCTPHNAALLEKPSLDESLKVYTVAPSKKGFSVKNAFTITNYNVFDSSNLTEHKFRYVLPDFSASGFFEPNPKAGGSSHRPLSVQQTNLTISPLKNSDELKYSIDFETIDLSGQSLNEALAGSDNPPRIFDVGAKCYKVVNLHNHQDFIQYDTSHEVKFTVDKNGVAKDYQKTDFGRYTYYTPQGEALEAITPTDVVVVVHHRFFKGTFYPKKTYDLESSHEYFGLTSAYFLDKTNNITCHLFNDQALKTILTS